MKELEITFIGRGEVRGHEFKQLYISANGYLYQKTANGNVNYEVFRRMENKQFNCVSYPGSNSFGIWAWQFTDLDKALAKFNSL